MDNNCIEYLLFWILDKKIERKMEQGIKIDDLVNYVKNIDYFCTSEEYLENDCDDYECEEIEEYDYDNYEYEESECYQFEQEYRDNEYEEYEENSLLTTEDIREAIEKVVLENHKYFRIKDGYIYFNILHDTMKENIEEEINRLTGAVDASFIETIESDIQIYELIGIDYGKELLHEIVENEKKLEELYFGDEFGEGISLASCEILREDNQKIKKEIRRRKAASRMLTEAYLQSMEFRHEYDAAMGYLASLEIIGGKLYDINSSDCSREEITDNYSNAFYDALFFREDIYLSVVREKLEFYLAKLNLPLYEIPECQINYWNKQKNLFLGTLYFLNEEIKKSFYYDEEIINCLIEVKYNAMEVLDCIFDLNIFEGMDILENVDKLSPDAGSIAYVLAEDILGYKDVQYDTATGDIMQNKLNIVNNIIKMTIIKAYYYLSEDQNLVEYIKANPNYGVNKISSNIINHAIDSGEIRRTKKKAPQL